jgi:hypothetical protein
MLETITTTPHSSPTHIDRHSPVKLLVVLVPFHRVQLLLADVVGACEHDHIAYVNKRRHDDAGDVEGSSVGQDCD